jgi:hypothetical protein
MIVKPVSILFVLLFLSVSCFAQNATSDGSGITVIKKKWHRELRDPALDRDSNQETSDIGAEDIRRRQIEQTNDTLRAQGMPVREIPGPQLENAANKPERSSAYVYEITVRNDSSKDISSVTWEYVFSAPNAEQEVGRRRFTSKGSIAHGKTRTLTVRSAIPPTGTVDAVKINSRTAEQYIEKIVIVSVEYTDGTKWTSSSATPRND